MSKQKRTVDLPLITDRPPKAKRGTSPHFVDLTDSLTPLMAETEEQAEQVRRAMVGWSNYITRLSAHSMDRETAFLVARAYLRRGVGHTALSEWQAAVSDLTQVITMQVGEAENNTAILYRARAFDGLGSDGHAIDDLTRVLTACEQAIDPKGNSRLDLAHVAPLYAYRALLYCRLDSFDLAVSDCDRAICLADDCAEAYSVRGSAFRHLGETERALSDCNRSVELEERPVLYYRRALVLQQRGDYSQALTDLEHALHFEPTNSQFKNARDTLLLYWIGSLGLASPTKTQIAATHQGNGGHHA